jgi:hypothetical protein
VGTAVENKKNSFICNASESLGGNQKLSISLSVSGGVFVACRKPLGRCLILCAFPWLLSGALL